MSRSYNNLQKNVNPPLLRYFGGKHRDAHRIIAQMPPHDFYVEPFCGGASVLLAKQPSKFEVINDLSGDVVNFFRVLRDTPQDLIRAIELTPYSRQEWQQAFEATEEPLERARRLYVRSWQSHGGGCSIQRNGGWRFLWQQTTGENVVANFNRVDHLWIIAKRLKEVQIDCDDALKVIERYGRNPQALLYVDPPYVHSTRVEKSGYDHEMTNEQHEGLASLLKNIKAMSLVSGYDCSLYQELFKGWQCVRWNTQTNGSDRQECLWISPNCFQQLPLLNLLSMGEAL